MDVEIKFMRFEHRHGRLVALAQLYSGQKLVHSEATLAFLLSAVAADDREIKIINAEEILTTLVIQGGFAS